MFTFRLLFFQPFEVTDNNDSLLNFDTSWGLFEETTSSNIATFICYYIFLIFYGRYLFIDLISCKAPVNHWEMAL